MKKFISLILVSIMITNLVACGGGDKNIQIQKEEEIQIKKNKDYDNKLNVNSDNVEVDETNAKDEYIDFTDYEIKTINEQDDLIFKNNDSSKNIIAGANKWISGKAKIFVDIENGYDVKRASATIRPYDIKSLDAFDVAVTFSYGNKDNDWKEFKETHRFPSFNDEVDRLVGLSFTVSSPTKSNKKIVIKKRKITNTKGEYKGKNYDLMSEFYDEDDNKVLTMLVKDMVINCDLDCDNVDLSDYVGTECKYDKANYFIIWSGKKDPKNGFYKNDGKKQRFGLAQRMYITDGYYVDDNMTQTVVMDIENSDKFKINKIRDSKEFMDGYNYLDAYSGMFKSEQQPAFGIQKFKGVKKGDSYVDVTYEYDNIPGNYEDYRENISYHSQLLVKNGDDIAVRIFYKNVWVQNDDVSYNKTTYSTGNAHIIGVDFKPVDNVPVSDSLLDDSDLNDYYKYLNNEQINEVNKFVDNFYEEFIKEKIDTNSDDWKFKREMEIVKFFVDNYKYDNEAYEKHINGDKSNKIPYTSYAVFINKTAVCDGFASAFALLCEKCDIPVKKVYQPSVHSWNIVQLDDGEWYHVDVTWNVCRNSYVYYTNFNDDDVNEFWTTGNHFNWKPENAKSNGTNYNREYVTDYIENKYNINDNSIEDINAKKQIRVDNVLDWEGLHLHVDNICVDDAWCYYYMDSDGILHYSSTKPNINHMIYGSTFGYDDITNPPAIEEEIRKKVKKIIIDNNINANSCRGWFSNFEAITEIEGLNKINTSNVNDMSWMFFDCISLENIDLSNFDTSNVETMEGIFSGCSSIKNIDVSKFNTENVKNMRGLFSDCIKLESIDVSNFNISNVTNMNEMFYKCEKIDEIDLRNFIDEKCESFTNMFTFCENLKIINCSEELKKSFANIGLHPIGLHDKEWKFKDNTIVRDE